MLVHAQANLHSEIPPINHILEQRIPLRKPQVFFFLTGVMEQKGETIDRQIDR